MRRVTTTLALLLVVLLVVTVLCSASVADAARTTPPRKSSSSTAGKTSSESRKTSSSGTTKKRPTTTTTTSSSPSSSTKKAAAPKKKTTKMNNAPAKLGEQYYEDRYHEYQKALPSPNSGRQMVTARDAEEARYIRSLNVGKLRQYLHEREANCPGCVEKLHLVERAMQVRGWETENDKISQQITPHQLSAENAISMHHLGSGSMSVDATGNPMVPITQSKQQLQAIQLSHGIHCTERMNNGTQYCHQVAPDSAW